MLTSKFTIITCRRRGKWGTFTQVHACRCNCRFTCTSSLWLRFEAFIRSCVSCLQVVDLSYNKISTCPRDLLGCINNLLVLNLSYNRLETWPAGLHVPGLVVLNLSFNRLWQVPPDVGQQMPALQQLYLANNCLKELPDSLAQLELRDLFVSENDLQVVPKVGPSCWCQ